MGGGDHMIGLAKSKGGLESVEECRLYFYPGWHLKNANKWGESLCIKVNQEIDECFFNI